MQQVGILSVLESTACALYNLRKQTMSPGRTSVQLGHQDATSKKQEGYPALKLRICVAGNHKPDC